MTTVRQDALDQASKLIHGDRNKDYGPPEVNFRRIADRWSQTLDMAIEPWQVALMMADVKVARLAEGYHEDSVIDLIGYAALAAELKGND